jgi:hypothetical protein
MRERCLETLILGVSRGVKDLFSIISVNDLSPCKDDEGGEHMASESALKMWGYGKDVLVVAVIPLVVWVINLSVQNAERDLHIKSLQGDVAELTDQLQKIEVVRDDLGKANLQMVRLEGKIDLANGRLDEIKSLLH